MDIFTRFKTYYVHYLIGIIVPAVVNSISIPLLKYWIGAAAYGEYALYFNALLITNVLLSGWLSQSITRFAARSGNMQVFGQQVLQLSIIAPVLLIIPVIGVVWYLQDNFLLGVLFAATLFLASVQLTLQALTQAKFLSKVTLVAEAIRTGSWLIIASLLLFLHFPFLPSLFTALFLSYLCSSSFLLHHNRLNSSNILEGIKAARPLGKVLLTYGLPLSILFMCSYLIIYVDKLIMLHFFGSEMQGNYNALFDFISRGLVLLMTPVLTSATPLISETYEKGEQKEIKKLLQRLIGYELLIMASVLLGYYFIGYKWLAIILKIPDQGNFFIMGLIIIVATILWQIALLLQKPLELQFQTKQILGKAILAFSAQLLFYLIVSHKQHPVLVPVGYFVAATVYLLLMVWSSYTNKYLPLKKGKI